MDGKIQKDADLVTSYLNLRKFIGILAISLPFILVIGEAIFFNANTVQPSISDYYYTGMHDVFVGILFTFGVFLFSYKGPEPADDIAGDLACLFAVGVALFPTTQAPEATTLIGYIHATSASLFFLTLSYFSIVLFTKTNPDQRPTPRKLLRNRVYKICGYSMLACMALVIIYFLLPDSMQAIVEAYKPVFVLETIMILLFGISWFIKGDGLLKD